MKNRKTEPNLDLARRIRAAGADIYIEEDAPQIPTNGLRIRQTGGVTESCAFDFYGAAGYILSVAISCRSSPFRLSSWNCRTRVTFGGLMTRSNTMARRHIASMASSRWNLVETKY